MRSLLASLLGLCLTAQPSAPAQNPHPLPNAGGAAPTATTPIPLWRQAADPPMKFEVASIREDKGEFTPPSFALSADDWFRDPHGRFHADFELPVYIAFAWKLWLSPTEINDLLAGQPAWVKSTRFAIQATAPTGATKDQYRLMMQSLLADRFGLRLHFTSSERPVLAMLLVTPGHPGPHLIPHVQGPACDTKVKPPVFPYDCYSYAAEPTDNGQWINGSRATTMDLLANYVTMSADVAGEASRRVVDQTGLTGLWDFTLVAAPSNPSPTSNPQPPSGPTFLEALRDQLGLHLKPSHAAVSLPVIDHLTRPTEN